MPDRHPIAAIVFASLAATGFVATSAAAAPEASSSADATKTERLYLSGTGLRDTVDWEFSVSAGRGADRWTTIPVPSHWEQHGFGSYNYGHDDDPSAEVGRYRYRFAVPSAWRGRRIELVFGGVMTDAEVTLNGVSAGPRHQGAFYRFGYDVGELVRFDDDVPGGSPNLLEVEVAKRSADASVNRAERDADYWIFGGIFRPVYLAASPPTSIAHVAIDARHLGQLTARLEISGADRHLTVEGLVETLDGTAVAPPLRVRVGPGTDRAELSGVFAGIEPWSDERPNLYRLRLRLRDADRVVHERIERIGFRTVDWRPGEGLMINGQRVLLRGVNRHAFWPASGRTLDAELDRRDAELLKAMNLNAVRAAHYPPDVSFLEACDELGIYVLDELAGWHDAYGTGIGRRLVAETVRRDVNHPSIIAWNNGNEGGWNRALDGEFALHDPQRRPVLHPDESFGGVDTMHYPTWDELLAMLDPRSWTNRWRALFGELPLVLPTEMLHGLYDGGSGAGLDAYWERLRSSPRAAGAFLWALSDEAIARTDRGGALDSDGNHGPDGVLGPYREIGANFHAVRDVLAPVQISGRAADAAGLGLEVENRYAFTDLSETRFRWRLIRWPSPTDEGAAIELAGGEVAGPPVPPGGRDRLRLPLAEGWETADALAVVAHGRRGEAVQARVLPIYPAAVTAERWTVGEPAGTVEQIRAGDQLRLVAGDTVVEIGLSDGRLVALADGDRRLELSGPRTVGGKTSAEATVEFESSGAARGVTRRTGGEEIGLLLDPSGWLRVSWTLRTTAPRPSPGLVVGLPRPPDRWRWLGHGAHRVWGNRQRGGTLAVWEAELTDPRNAGYFADLRWARLSLGGADLLVVAESDGLFVGPRRPSFAEDSAHAVADLPDTWADGALGLFHAAPAIGTKFHPAAELGPTSAPAPAATYAGAVWLRLAAPAW